MKTFTIELNEEQINIINGALEFALKSSISSEAEPTYEEAELIVGMIASMKTEAEQPDYDVNTIHGFCR